MKIKLFTAAVLALGAASVHAATYTQTGVKNDVSYSSVVEGGWQLVSQSNYGGSLSISDLFAGLTPNTQVMIGAMHHNSGVIDVLAGATLSEITTYTGYSQTHSANGAEWYFNGYSMGFAGLGKTISQYSADVSDLSDRDRLSWHTSLTAGMWDQNYALTPLYVYDGWRSGNNINIYDNTDWDRVVFAATAVTAVPEPETYAMLLAGLGLMGVIARRRKQA